MKKICFIITIICLFLYKNVNALTNIEVENYSLIPYFNKNIKTYNIYLPENTNEINIICTKEENELEVKNEGIVYLKKGLNIIELIVISNDNSEKTYTLNVNVGDIIIDKDNAYLDKLEIEGYYIEFKPEILNYEINIDEIVDELKINYKPQNGNANVELTGSKNLNLSKNIIEIKVTSENKNKVNIYRITANKIIPTFENIDTYTNIFGKKTLTKKEKIVIISVISIISFLLILIFYILIFKKKTNKLLNT